jgi:hypothetical protein
VQTEATIACDPNAVAPEEQQRWIELARLIYGAFQEIRELPDGYAARLPTSKEMLLLLAEDLDMERRCCPFYSLHHRDRAALWCALAALDWIRRR